MFITLAQEEETFHGSTFAKQIAMIEANYQKPIVYVGNLNTLRTISDVRDAVRPLFISHKNLNLEKHTI